MTYMATPLHYNSCPVGHEIYNFLVFTITIHLVCTGVEKKIFFRNTSILHFLPQNYLPLDWTLQMLHTKFG